MLFQIRSRLKLPLYSKWTTIVVEMDNDLGDRLMGLFRSKARTIILLNFFINPNKEFYTRELERKFNIPVGNVRRELKKIEKSGIIISRSQGNLLLYKINKSNPLYPQFRELVIKIVGIQELIKPFLFNEKDVIAAFIYGSYARGNFDQTSDIDIFVLSKKNSDFYQRLNEKLLKFEEMLGRDFNIDFFIISEYKKKKRQKDPYLLDILNNKKIFIKGGEDEL